ncbi:helix-turn-helix transcriptional regulator [Novosphingobium huizhouense]|uniref:helix-turn-helix transcriptional regulator n=1 Tax=Novosphingobium huizhouense TaxID=2866625 RepID=UPI001CD866AB|nr:AlpA family transcriptional regulator [Novosphingobium huizhouense]
MASQPHDSSPIGAPGEYGHIQVSPLLRKPEVIRQTGLSDATINRLVKADSFPRPRRIGLRAVAWLQSEIDEWKLSRPPNNA